MSQCDLYDLRHTGNFLSWRGVRHTHTVHCRLDRAMSNSLWAELYPSRRCSYLDFGGSDHRSLITMLEPDTKRKKGLFRYDRRLYKNEEVRRLITTTWNNIELPVEERIAACRQEISRWNRLHHQNSQATIKTLKLQLEEAMTSSADNTLLIKETNQALKEAYKEEEEYWRQRSITLWLALGDKNTGFFHATARIRRVLNKFSVIENSFGDAVFEESEILTVITDYFSKLFTSSGSFGSSIVEEALSATVSAEDNDNLSSIPTPKEIKDTLFSFHPDKAPGPDGFSAAFFRTNWGTVGPAIIAEITHYFEHETMPHNINHTHIRLIPKITTPITVADYRPIALCNVYYKIVSKIITRRLQPILNMLIGENQSAFVRDRAISDNIMITHETLHFLKRSGAVKHCSMAVKTDMSKAYDRLEWNFIDAVLKRFGIQDKFRGCIMRCISSVTYSILLNGDAQGMITPTRGIRQGDPLSPYIFILCSEVLSGLCFVAQRQGRLAGVRIARGCPRINHLLFADDTIFFVKTSPASVEALKEILRKYESVSGQMINTNKSAITFSKKTPLEIRDRVKASLGISKEGGVGKYLGLPEHFGRRKKDMFTSIVDRVRQKAASWRAKHLSAAGKLVMLNSVLSAVRSHPMTCFKLPKSLTNRIQSALTWYWWDSNPNTKKICWVSWDKLATSKRDGGLGFREVESINDALLAKQSWRILQRPECLLARVLLGKYCRTEGFMSVQASNACSHGWRSILVGRDLLLTNTGKTIGNGRDTSIWNDPWLSTTTLARPMGPPEQTTKDLKVADLLSPATGDWDKDVINRILPHEAPTILCLKPSKTGAQDKHC